MARMRVFIVFALAIGVGTVFAFATYNYVQRAPKAASVDTVPVVVAAANLDVGAELGRDDIRVVDWPAGSAPTAAIGAPEEVIGRGLIMPVVQNEPILPMKLASKEAGAGLPPVIPPGFRALSVRVNEVIGVAGYVLPGTHVDVVATVNPSSGGQQEVTSKLILPNVQVLAAGTKIDRETDKDKPMPVSVVTLLVDPEQAERLTLAASEGKIQLALRNPLDKATPPTPGVRPAALLGAPPPVRVWKPRPVQAVKAEPIAPPAPEPITVEIIRGDKRAREIVRQEQQ